jgi:5-methyltetrahydrofolate--homocysteine methyltransferase
MLGIVESLRVSSVPLVALPDIGIPTIIDGFPVYNAEPSYVAAAARRLVEHGACIIGADGGADVTHVRAIAEAVAGARVGSSPVSVKRHQRDDAESIAPPAPTPFGAALGKRLLTTV